nr:hypothetical protein [Tanacetum cinerariifolium]
MVVMVPAVEMVAVMLVVRLWGDGCDGSGADDGDEGGSNDGDDGCGGVARIRPEVAGEAPKN